MSTSSSDALPKDRKKSAHWSEHDTEILINVLLRHKDTSRTTDNGFKLEVWREISELLEGTTVTGGPKTPEACKSRWQRLQRDYKAAKELEAVPGFSWDHSSSKLVASPADWDAVEKQWEAGKFQRLHIPLYNSIALLCPDERIRGTITRSRKSLGSISDASSMLSLSVSSAGPPQTPTLSMPPGHVLMDGSGMHGINLGDNPAFQWDGGDMDAEGEFDATYQMHDGSAYVMAPAHGKRSHYDPSLLGGPSTTTAPLDMSSRGHAPKRQRSQQSLGGRAQQMTYHIPMPPSGMGASPIPSPTSYSTGQHGMLLDPALISPATPISMQLQQQQTLQSTHQQQAQHRHMHTRSQLQMSSAHPIDTQQVSHIPKQPTHNRAHPPTPHAHTPPQPVSNRQPHTAPPRHTLPLSPPFDMDASRASPGSGETHMPEAQRRTQAIMQLQRESELSDEDVMEIMAEFETNIPAMDTYLALQRDSLRRKYLSSLVTRRSGAPVEAGRR